VDMWTVIAIISIMTLVGLIIGNHNGFCEGYAIGHTKGNIEGYKECAEYVKKELFKV